MDLASQEVVTRESHFVGYRHPWRRTLQPANPRLLLLLKISFHSPFASVKSHRPHSRMAQLDSQGDSQTRSPYVSCRPGQRVAYLRSRYEARKVAVSGGFAYVPCDLDGLQIIDINPPESAYILTAVEPIKSAEYVHIVWDYAFVGDDRGLRIIQLW
jgi:hypothetical protein